MTKKDSIIWELNAGKVKEKLINGSRLDGRKFDEIRKIEVQTGISKNAHGSARVKIGGTEVLSGVMLMPGAPYPDSPDEGTISVGAELMPLASPLFENGPPREEAIELARVVDRGIREGGAVDFKKLCITEGELVWIAFVDFYVSNQEGNMFDTAGLAAIASLLDARKPKLEDGKVIKGEFEGKLEIDKVPILTTFAKIDDSIIADPTLAEEKATDARLSIATTEKGELSAFQKGGSGSLNASDIDKCVDWALKIGKDMRKNLKQ